MKLNKVLLRNTARAWGIQPSYISNQVVHWSPENSIVKVLSDLTKKPIESDQDLQNLMTLRRQKQIQDGLLKSIVLWGGHCQAQYLYLDQTSLTQNVNADVHLENGDSQKLSLQILETKNRASFQRLKIYWPEQLPLGYHQLSIEIGDKKFTSLLISAPEKLETAKELEHSWGPFVPLYALRTGTEWGIGSLKEMKLALEKCGEYGAKWLGTLPLLAVNLDPEDCDPSPYSALTRLFWNEVFLDVEGLVQKYDHTPAQQFIATEEFQAELASLRATTHVDYHRVYKLKKRVLKLLSDDFFASKQDQEKPYQSFKADNPEIDNYACFRSTEIDQQNFHRFVQFEMNECLREITETVPQGLYLDFPVGVNDSGFDFKEFNSVFFKEVSVGAPPEEVFQQGQDWGFPAFNPFSHREEGYQYLRKSLKNHLKFCKILRMDHVMGLYRVFCIPKKWTAFDGIYMRFPKDDLFAISMLEAFKAKADIVGENLGTVPAAVDELIHKRNINGMYVLQMETWRKPEDAFARTPANAMISFNNHDMPMWASFMKGTDLDLVCSLNILHNDSRIKFQTERKKQIQEWSDYAHPQDITIKLHEKMAKSAGKYLVVTLEDFWGEEAPQNIPGTWKEYPNWRRKYSRKMCDWTEDAKAIEIFRTLKKYRS